MQLDYTRDNLFDSFGLKTLKDRYMEPGETSPQDAFARVAAAYSDDAAHAQRIYDYVSQHWFMFSTPILANGGTNKGLPISCFLMYAGDSREEIGAHYVENMWLATEGGGVSGAWSDVRQRGALTSTGNQVGGVIPHLKTLDSSMLEWKQGSTRKSSYAAYLDLDHPEIEEFIRIRQASNTSDIDRKCLNLHNAVNIPDSFMEIIERCMLDKKASDDWDLKDRKTGEVVKTISAKKLWQDLLVIRLQTGEPYFHFIDRANEFLPKWLKDKGLRINSSNLCIEIELPTSPDRTAVCCLSSINAAKFDAWSKNDLFIEDLCRFLDNVLTDFCKKAPPALAKAVRSATSERSIGIGMLGFHTALQQQGIPFESMLASSFNYRLFKHVRTKADTANKKLALEKGEAPDAVGYGVRMSHLMAVAPNASSSIYCGNVSPSCEPNNGNAFGQKTLSGWNIRKNNELIPILEKHGKNDEKTWISICEKDGSVQHLKFLTDDEKSVFKTAYEISQLWVIEHAYQRMEFIDQGQSINLFFAPTAHPKYLSDVHFMAWKKRTDSGRGIKGLYYVRSDTVLKPKVTYDILATNVAKDDECLSCQG